MASEKREKKKVKWVEKLRNKYRLVFMNDETLEERFTFRLSRLNVFVALGTLTILLIFLTSILIAFTPLKEYIPGYTNVGLQKKLYELQLKTDSIEKNLAKKDKFIQNLKDIINGKDLTEDLPLVRDTLTRYKDIKLKRSEEDSLLRMQIDNQSKYHLYKMETMETTVQRKSTIGSLLFFVPLKGIITNEYNALKQHYGIDIVAKENETIKSVLDGTVIFTNWTLETGYVIAIQHHYNLVSIYKHNSSILKNMGDRVRAGEPISIIGNTGELASGPHLHFELWCDGSPVNPKDYITF